MDNSAISIDKISGYKVIVPRHKVLDDGSIIMRSIVRTYDREGNVKVEAEVISGRVTFN